MHGKAVFPVIRVHAAYNYDTKERSYIVVYRVH